MNSMQMNSSDGEDRALLDLIRAVEAVAYDAWPPLEDGEIDGWRLRAAQGITGRANSVWALGDEGTRSTDEKIAAAESFYAAQGLAPRFQINAAVLPPALDQLLSERSYRVVSPTYVQVAPIAVILERTPPLKHLSGATIEIAEEFDADWFEIYRRAEAMDEKAASVRAAILQRIALPIAYARLDFDGKPAAIGLGVVGERRLGVFCMETLPDYRRRGAATALLRTLAIWAGMQDATDAYLQVTAPNTVAQAVYARAGFTTAYRYHYRVREPEAGAP